MYRYLPSVMERCRIEKNWREIHAVFWVIFYPVWLLPLLQAVGGITEAGGPEICQSKVIFSMRPFRNSRIAFMYFSFLNGKVCNKIKDRCLLTVPNPHARSNKELWGLVFIVRLEPPQVLRDASLIRLSYQKKHTTTYVGYKTWPIRTKPLQPCLKNSDENVVYNTYGSVLEFATTIKCQTSKTNGSEKDEKFRHVAVKNHFEDV